MDGYFPYYNDLNDYNNIEDPNEEPPYNSEKISALFVLIIAITLIVMDLLSLYYSYDYLLYASKRFPFDVFDQCIKYDSLTEIYFTLFAFMAAISAGLMALGILMGYDLFFEKFLVTFLNFNYYIFGLLLLASSLIGLFNYNKICYDCIKRNPEKREFNLSTMICLILIASIGGIITFIFSSLNSFEYVCNCIKFSKDGNYFFGKAFWKFILFRNNENQNLHERID